MRNAAVFYLLLILAPSAAYGQQAARLESSERRLGEIEELIEQDRRRLSTASAAEKASVQTLEQINREIALREELRNAYTRRLRMLAVRGDSIDRSMGSLKAKVTELQGEYQVRAIHAYKHGRMHELALILSAESINQMLVRARYLWRFAEQRRRKMAGLGAASNDLFRRKAELDSARVRNEELLADSRTQEQNLARLRRERQEVLADLRSEKGRLQESLARKNEAARDLRNIVRKLAPSRSALPARAAFAPSGAARPAGSFLQQQGRLPWPVAGVVKEAFGSHVSPIYGTTTSNPGIIIASNPAVEARAVFDGEVVLIDVMPEYGTIVAVAHGEYKTVYANFSSIVVKQGDRVGAGDVIGMAGRDTEPQGAGLFFAVFKEGEPVDPEKWLEMP